DSSIFVSRTVNGGKPIQMPLPESRFRGDMSAGLAMLSAGDSAVIRISVDTMMAAMKGQPRPPFAKPGDYFIYEVSMVSVKSKEDYQKEMQQKTAQQAGVDDKMLQD